MKCDAILCVDKLPEKDYLLFFGDTGHFIRVDRVHYPIFKNLYEKAFADFWTVQAIDFSQDRVGWEKLDDNARRMFLLNNGYQTLMDSGVVNLYNKLVEITSLSELAILYQYIAQNETVHSASYSYGLQQMFGAEVEDKINIVYEDKVVKQRLHNEVDLSTPLFKMIQEKDEVDDGIRKQLLKVLVATYVLEYIKFPYSFLITWRLNEGYGNGIQGFSMLLKMIAWDELTTHTVTNGNVLKILMKEERQEFSHLKDWLEEFIVAYVKKIVDEELEWNDYLFSKGEVKGITKQIGENFIKHYADKSLRFLGLNSIYNEEKSDIIQWYEDYRNINKQNTALQEVSNNAYQKGKLKEDLQKLDNVDVKWR